MLASLAVLALLASSLLQLFTSAGSASLLASLALFVSRMCTKKNPPRAPKKEPK